MTNDCYVDGDRHTDLTTAALPVFEEVSQPRRSILGTFRRGGGGLQGPKRFRRVIRRRRRRRRRCSHVGLKQRLGLSNSSVLDPKGPVTSVLWAFVSYSS
jgi:hypothetical protein